jgi:hypothetical protein
MDLVFDQVFQVAGEDLPQRLGFKVEATHIHLLMWYCFMTPFL